MNKKLLILTTVAIVLIVGITIKNSRQQNSIIDETNAEAMLDNDFLVADVTSMVMYDGQNKDTKLKISSDNGKWIITSSYGAKAKEKKIIEFFQQFKKTVGELRTRKKKHHGAYKVSEETGFHLQIYRGDKQDSFIIGKGIDDEGCFIRKADSDDVYRIGGEIRPKLDLAQKNNELRTDTWLKKEILDLDTAKMKKLTVTYPDKKLLFSRIEVVEKGKEVEDKNKKAQPKKKRYTWALVEGNFGRDFKEEALKSYLDNISECKITDVADPKNRKKYGLDNPSFRIEVSLNTGVTKAFVASYVQEEKKGYGYIDDQPGLIYMLEKWRFQSLFKQGSEVFDLPELKIKKEDIVSIEVTTPEQKATLIQQDAKWNASPQWAEDTINNLVTTISNISPKDYTTLSDENTLGLSSPSHKIKITLKDGNNHEIFSSAKKSLVIDGFYVGIDKNKPHVVIGSDDFNKLFPPVKKQEKVITDPKEEKTTNEVKEENNKKPEDTREKSDEEEEAESDTSSAKE